MKSRPILFSAPMVRALLDGRKSQTRRIFKDTAEDFDGDGHPIVRLKGDLLRRADCPYGKPGDLLWVREAFSGPHSMEKTKESRAVSPSQWPEESEIWYWADGEPDHGDWTRPRPSIHMTSWASRLTLEITGVRVERLNDISRKDAAAEGVCLDLSQPLPDWCQKDRWPEENYKALWESLNGLGSWDANPWVWVLEFKVHRCNVGDILK